MENLGAVGICNMALLRLGLSPLHSLDSETSNEARSCNSIYGFALRHLLRQHNWPFAVKTVLRAPLETNVAEGWDYTFSRPSDVVRIIEVRDADGNEVEYELFSEGIASNSSTIKINYIYYNEEVATYTSDFIDSLSLYIAHSLAVTLVSSVELQKALWQEFRLSLSNAKTFSSSERVSDMRGALSEWEEARLGL